MLQMISMLNKCHSFQLSINERILNFLKNFHKSIKQKKIYITQYDYFSCILISD